MNNPASLVWPSLASPFREQIAREVAKEARNKGFKMMSLRDVMDFFDTYSAGQGRYRFTSEEEQKLVEIATGATPPVEFNTRGAGAWAPEESWHEVPSNGQSRLPRPPPNGHTNGGVVQQIGPEGFGETRPVVATRDAVMKSMGSGALLVEPDHPPVDSTDLYKKLAGENVVPPPALPVSQYPKTIDTPTGPKLNPAYEGPKEEPEYTLVDHMDLPEKEYTLLDHSSISTRSDTDGQNPGRVNALTPAQAGTKGAAETRVENPYSNLSLEELIALRDSKRLKAETISSPPAPKAQEPGPPYPPRGPLASKPAMAFTSSPARADETTVSQEAEGRRWQSPPVSSQPRYVEPAGSISNRALGVMIAFLAGAVPTMLLGFLEAERMVVPPVQFLTPIILFAMALGCVGAALVTTVVG